jgi:hypothetical protein
MVISIKAKVMLLLKSLIASVAVFFLSYFLFTHDKPNDTTIDLSNFKGRIFKETEVKPGTFTINVPISEAKKWGEEAILRYGEKGVEIWKPDTKTAGVFLYSKIGNEGKKFIKAKVCFIEKTLTIKFYVDIWFWVLFSVLSILIYMFVWELGKISLNNKYTRLSRS